MFDKLRHQSASSPTLLDIVSEVRRRWRVKLLMRGAVSLAAMAFLLLVGAAYGMEAAGFSATSILVGRIALALALVGCAAWFLLRPLRRNVTDEQVALYLEEHEPSLQETLLSAVEASRGGRPESAALVRRVVEQAIERCSAVDAPRRVERLPMRRYATAFALVAAVAVLAVLFGPGVLRNAVSALFLFSQDIEAAVPYRIEVTPGDASVARGADQVIVAKLLGFTTDNAVVMARRSPTSKFEAVPLVRGEKGTYEGLLFDVAEPLEYRVEAGRVVSDTFTLKVVDLPYVKQMSLEFRFPAYTGLEPQKIEDGGDVAALRGTEVHVRIVPTMKTPGGRLTLNDKDQIALAAQPDGSLTGVFKVDADGFYRVELVAPTGEHVAGSPQFTIDALTDQPPAVSFRRPGRDTNVSPIEEVFVEANAEDD
jgi:hypothetical protein